ncbi:MAG TPA: FAD-dependent oxidoreductase [Sphingomonadales bacterium]
MTQADVLIIGGGLAGCAAAYYLARGGAAVLLVEMGQVNGQASGQNAGSLHFQLEHRLIEHADQAEQFAQVIPLNLLAIEEWSRLEEELDAFMDVTLHGGLMLAETEADLALLRKKYALEKQWGLPTELLTAEEVRAIAPYLSDKVIAAGYCPREGHGNPRLVTPAFARGAQRHGAKIRTGTKVADIRRVNGRWSVALEGAEGREMATADVILNAAGAWAADVARMVNLHLPVFPVALAMNVTEAGPPLVHHLIQHAGRRLSMKQVSDGHILIGGGWSSRFRRAGDRILKDRRPVLIDRNVAENLKIACDVVPDLRSRNLLRSWTGIVGITADQLPILGEMPEAPGFFVATGGSGFTLGPVYGRLMSELILEGRPSHRIDLYSPRRFRHINMFMG